MELAQFLLEIIFLGFVTFFAMIAIVLNALQAKGLIIPAIVLICGASLSMVIVKWLARKIKEGESMKFYLSCYTGLLKNPYFYLVEFMAIIAVWDKAWMLALMYGLAFPFIAANAIFLGNKLKK